MSGGVHVAWSFWLPETFKNVRDAKLSDNVVPMPQYGDQFWILNTSMSERILIQRATSTGLPQRASRICASVVTARCFFFFSSWNFRERASCEALWNFELARWRHFCCATSDICAPAVYSERCPANLLHLLVLSLPKWYMWSGERLSKMQATARPDHVWPEVWTKIGTAAQNREKQEWANENTQAPQCSETERNLLFRTKWSRKRVKKTEILVAAVILCKRKAPRGITKVFAQLETAPEKTHPKLFMVV